MHESRSNAGRIRFAGALLITQESSGTLRGDLWVDGGRIAAVTPAEPAPSWEPGTWTEADCSGLWIIPGLIQTHTHLCQSLFRGAADGRTLYRWLSEAIWPLEAAHDPWTIGISAVLAIRQLLANGTTTILDMGTTRHTGVLFEVADQMGIRAFLGPALMDRGPAEAESLLRKMDEALDEVRELAAEWDGRDDGRLRMALCPRFVPSVTEPFWRAMAGDPGLASCPLHTHGCETREEVEDVMALTGGLTPPAFLARLPGAEGRVKMAHGVHLSDQDRVAMASAGIAVLHCPGSNLKLGSGLADVAAMQEAGVRVGIGADGAPCNNRLDPWGEMRSAAAVRTLLHGPQSVSGAEILALATLGGATVLDLQDEIGSLTRGKRADFVLLDPGNDPATAGGGAVFEKPEDLLVFAGSPEMVMETWVGGRRVFRRGEMDRGESARLAADVAKARRIVAERAGI